MGHMQPKYLFFSLAPTVLQQFIINCQLIVSLKVKAAQPCSTPFTPWMNSPGQNTGVGSLSFLQGIFPTQGLNPGLPHCRQIPYQLSHKGSPRILEWVAYPFSDGTSQPRNLGFPALQVDSLPTELSGKPLYN